VSGSPESALLQEDNLVSDCRQDLAACATQNPAGGTRSREAELSVLTTRGGIFLGLRYGLGVLVSLGNMLVLTRWIGPHAYGVFVTVLGLTSFLAALSRVGIDTYLVRMEAPPDKRTYDVATSIILGISVVLVGIGAALVPLLVHWYGNREFVAAYLVTLVTIPLAGLAGPPTAKLERELNFRAVATVELGGQLLALAVSVVLAWQGFGLWAPVTGLLAWQAWAAAGAIRAAGLSPGLAVDRMQARTMLGFGIGYSTSLRVWQLRALVNPLLVGRFAGAEGVAFVALAIRIAEGLGFIRIAAGRLAIAALSRLQNDRTRFQSALESALQLQVLTLGPLLCLFALFAPVVVPRVLGVRWMPSLQVYPFVASGVLVNALYNLRASALFVTGESWVVLRAYAWHVVLLMIGTVLLLPRFGILGYGWAELAACGAYAALHTSVAQIAPVSLKKLGLLLSVFATPLFSLLVRGAWGLILYLPMMMFLIRVSWRTVLPMHSEATGPGMGSVLPLFTSMRTRIMRTGLSLICPR
jgi:O-antigen/teichoic acid export membrane protein